MNTYEELRTILNWEYNYQIGLGEREEVEGFELNLTATARKAWRELAKRGTLAELRAMPEEWQRFERLHLMALEFLDVPWLELEKVN